MPSSLSTKNSTLLQRRPEIDIPLIRLGPALLGWLAMMLLVFGVLPARIAHALPEVDMFAYYKAARAVLHHVSPYHSSMPSYGPDRFPVWYLYDPQFAAFISPLGKLSFRDYGGIWLVLLTSCLIGYAYNLARLTRPDAGAIDRSLDFMTWFLVLSITPGMLYSVGIGNIDIIVTFLTSAAFLSTRYRLLLFSLTMQVKPFALLPAAMSWVRERRSPRAALVCLVAGICLGLLVCGPASFLEWRRSVSEILGQGTFNPDNLSISFGILRLLKWMGLWHYGHGPLPAGPRLYLVLMSVAGPVLTAYASRRLPDLEYYALLLLSAALFAPICWRNYLVIGYLLVALRLRRRLCPEPSVDTGVASPRNRTRLRMSRD